ncbi:MAG TPA: asparagine--tRNA ligase [Fredinandcohnia sp.]|nr:asparagine--tRNA ligase [Fredinandcohnia sp.]
MSFPRAWIEEIARYEGQDVELRGWLDGKRSSGKLHFLQVRDGTGVIQCVMFKGDVPEDVFETADHLPQESAIKVRGTVRADARSPIGYEIAVKGMEVVSRAAPDYPIGRKEHGVAFLMDHRHLWLRSNRQRVIMAVRHTIVKAIRDFFDDRGFRLVDTPILTPSAAEGTTTLFEVPYFDLGKAYLAQTGQLYGEAAAMAFGKIYTFGPTFRAEKSKTRRHLTEFWMVEPEVAYMELDEAMDLAEDFIVHIVERVLDRHAKDLERVLERDVSKLETVKKPFPRITYDEALKILHELGNQTPWGEDFGGDEETLLASRYDRPVIVHRYPAQIKAFYFKRDPRDARLALGLDVLAPEGYGEIIGGGQREDDFDTLVQRIEEHGLPRENYEWYLDLRRWGTVPHAGFGLGLERTVAWICGLHHVRETIPFPRMMERITP